MAVKKKYDRNVLGRGLDDIGNGRGLDALIDTGEVRTQGSSNLNEVEISNIEPNPNQPRREFDQEALQELAGSIKELGIIQPITLRQMPGGKYQIIAGERRWRASQLAGLTKIPAYIVTVEDESAMEMALVENIQREDLNAIEIALAYQHLAETTGMTQAKISERVGKSRAAVTNYMRLLKAQMLKNGEDVKVAKGKTQKAQLPEEFGELRDRLANFFQTRVQMTCSPKGKGKISLLFNNEEELERIMNALDGRS